MREEYETGRGEGGGVPSVGDDADDEDVTTLNVQVEFDAGALPPPRPRLHTMPLPDVQLRRQYPSEPNPSVAIPQPPPSVPSLSSLDVPNWRRVASTLRRSPKSSRETRIAPRGSRRRARRPR